MRDLNLDSLFYTNIDKSLPVALREPDEYR